MSKPMRWNTLRGVSPHRLFSFSVVSLQRITFWTNQMDKIELTIAQQLADAARDFQTKQTGRAPSNVTVAVGEDTLVFTLHEVLSPAEQTLAKSAEGAANWRVSPTVISKFCRFATSGNREDHGSESPRSGRRSRPSAAEALPTCSRRAPQCKCS